MANDNQRQVAELAELSSAEMEQVQGGRVDYYLKVEGIEGDSFARG